MSKISVSGLRRLCLSGVVSTKQYWELKKRMKKKNFRVEYIRKPFEISKFTDDECRLFFRFGKDELICLLEALHIPQSMSLVNGIRFTGQEGLCLLLRRLAYPNRLSDLVATFHRDEGTISKIFNHMISHIYDSHAHRLHRLKQKYLTRSQLEELATNAAASGCPYPNVIGFIDGTARLICRPTYHQKEMYSGYKKHHVVKYQSIVLTNGLIGRLDGPFIGRRHDAAILHLSRTLDEFQTFLTNPDGTWYCVYGDPGYSNQKFVKVGFKNHAALNQLQKDFNANMSTLRVSVEYGFGKIIQQFAFLDFVKTQKVYQLPLKKMYFVCAFLVNCQSCMRGQNQISDIFKSNVPTLTEYLLL